MSKAQAVELTVKQGDQYKILDQIIADMDHVLLGKNQQICLALTCLLASGHLLIEDLPGMGKTLLSHTLAKILGLQFNRIQFTSDLLPSDIVGVSIFDKSKADFRFVPGPVFSELLLADEINRATPKSQSALLEAMEEQQVTVDAKSMLLPEPFFVIATQNPATQLGTYPLPESQLDRFLMRIELGYPDPAAERQLLQGGDRRALLDTIEPRLNAHSIVILQNLVKQVSVSDLLIDYVQRLVQYSRRKQEFACGLSPRGSLALLNAARAWATLQHRDHVIPEDVQAVLPSVAEHRLRAANHLAEHDGLALTQNLLANVDVIA